MSYVVKAATSVDEPFVQKRKKSRWADGVDTKLSEVLGMPTSIPSDLTDAQSKAYVLQLQIQTISVKLRNGDYEIPLRSENRSPSPDPVYDTKGIRVNTREARAKKKLEDERRKCIAEMKIVNPTYRPPTECENISRISARLDIPADKHPNINFVGLLVGPRGNTKKKLENETSTVISIKGRGSTYKKDLSVTSDSSEPLHVVCYGDTQSIVNNAVEIIRNIVDRAIDMPEEYNENKRQQLKELSRLNGTLQTSVEPMNKCGNCGEPSHKTWQCTQRARLANQVACSKCGGLGHLLKDCIVKIPAEPKLRSASDSAMDTEYQSLMDSLSKDQDGELGRNGADCKSREIENISSKNGKLKSGDEAPLQSLLDLKFDGPFNPSTISQRSCLSNSMNLGLTEDAIQRPFVSSRSQFKVPPGFAATDVPPSSLIPEAFVSQEAMRNNRNQSLPLRNAISVSEETVNDVEVKHDKYMDQHADINRSIEPKTNRQMDRTVGNIPETKNEILKTIERKFEEIRELKDKLALLGGPSDPQETYQARGLTDDNYTTDPQETSSFMPKLVNTGYETFNKFDSSRFNQEPLHTDHLSQRPHAGNELSFPGAGAHGSYTTSSYSNSFTDYGYSDVVGGQYSNFPYYQQTSNDSNVPYYPNMDMVCMTPPPPPPTDL